MRLDASLVVDIRIEGQLIAVVDTGENTLGQHEVGEAPLIITTVLQHAVDIEISLAQNTMKPSAHNRIRGRADTVRRTRPR